ncbi:hypothetical protein LCGC14_2792260 [marine sediment metagenome]|uniref:Uncharacterized protein n=1 Tax=marine sediment metagenome TaxID=412755 RepID=A0A0F9BGK5_9ZZZZ
MDESLSDKIDIMYEDNIPTLFVKEAVKKETLLLADLNAGKITSLEFFKERNKIFGRKLI